MTGCLIALSILLPQFPLAAADKAVSFREDIAPLLQAKCVTCHGMEKAKGGYRLHNFADLLKPGESKEVPITRGQPEASKLYTLLITADADDRMPQKDDALPASQIAMVRRWISEGARFDGGDSNALLSSLTAAAPHPPAPERYQRPEPVLALAFNPDGHQLLAGGYHEITVWNPTNGALLHRIPNMPRQVQAIAFSPDGKLLAVAGGTPGRSGEIRFVEVTNQFQSRVVATAGDFFLAFAFSPDGTRLIGGGADNTIRVIEVTSGRELHRLEQHADWVMGLAYAPDGNHFASASRDKAARLFDAKNGELEETYDGHGQPVFAVAFSPDSQRVLSAGRDREIHAWAAKDARRLFVTRGFEGDVHRLLTVGDQLISAGADRNLRLHRLQEKKAELVRTFAGHRDTVYSLAAHAASALVASGGYDGEVRVWNLESGQPVTSFIAAPGLASPGR